MLWKLSKPLYTATKVFTESDATCSARMVKMAPDPDRFPKADLLLDLEGTHMSVSWMLTLPLWTA